MACEELRVLELYSGVGGMHMALEGTGLPYRIVAALELNDIANNVYRFNFPKTQLLQRNIEGLSVDEFQKFNATALLMSPPCQPFTRVGNQKASDDPRTASFLNILRILESMQNPPRYILMENVKGFEESVTRNQFVAALERAKYVYQEFLVSPKQFGIPNSRLRYYLLAKLKPLEFHFKRTSQPMTELPKHKEQTHSAVDKEDIDFNGAVCERLSPEPLQGPMKREPQDINCALDMSRDSSVQANNSISNFLEKSAELNRDLYLSEETLGKLGTVLDIVTPLSTSSCCFTKAYASYVKGTGSVLCPKTDDEIRKAFEDSSNMDEMERGKRLLSLKLRYFSTREIAYLMCFPKSFDFPPNTTKKQQYKLLGNSINVLVVSELMKRCLFTELS